jgi:hypothetical protein
MRVMEEIAPSLEFQQCPRVEVGAWHLKKVWYFGGVNSVESVA